MFCGEGGTSRKLFIPCKKSFRDAINNYMVPNKKNFTNLYTTHFFQNYISEFKSKISFLEKKVQVTLTNYNAKIESVKLKNIKQKLLWITKNS
jgi:hypothetical protein